jgi:hypothetical protein
MMFNRSERIVLKKVNNFVALRLKDWENKIRGARSPGRSLLAVLGG